MAKAKLVEPHFLIWFDGDRWVEVEWPSDGRYDIGYQLAIPVHKEGHADYMGLFERADRRRVKDLPSGDMERYRDLQTHLLAKARHRRI